MDWDEISNIYRGPSIDASYQVSVHLAQWFQRNGRHRQFMFIIVCFLEKKLFFFGKGDNSNLNININKIQLAMN
jgi:hypothetical protein